MDNVDEACWKGSTVQGSGVMWVLVKGSLRSLLPVAIVRKPRYFLMSFSVISLQLLYNVPLKSFAGSRRISTGGLSYCFRFLFVLM